jgi:hypothetical protein
MEAERQIQPVDATPLQFHIGTENRITGCPYAKSMLQEVFLDRITPHLPYLLELSIGAS